MLDRRRKLPHTEAAAERAKVLRRNLTRSEAMLWMSLKNGSMRGYDFHRQAPILDYIVDFFCPRLMLAIEIDGESHLEKSDYDRERQKQIEALGVRFLRFVDLRVRLRPRDTVRAIEGWIDGEEARELANQPPPPE